MSLLETAALTLMSPALLAGDNNPATNPCLDCGACCAHFRVSFYSGEMAGETGGTVPEDMAVQIGPLRACMRGTEMGNGRCVALRGELGKLRRKPLAGAWRSLKLRRELGYWGR